MLFLDTKDEAREIGHVDGCLWLARPGQANLTLSKKQDACNTSIYIFCMTELVNERPGLFFPPRDHELEYKTALCREPANYNYCVEETRHEYASICYDARHHRLSGSENNHDIIVVEPVVRRTSPTMPNELAKFQKMEENVQRIQELQQNKLALVAASTFLFDAITYALVESIPWFEPFWLIGVSVNAMLNGVILLWRNKEIRESARQLVVSLHLCSPTGSDSLIASSQTYNDSVRLWLFL